MWNYRIIRNQWPKNEASPVEYYYQIHECYYENGKVYAWTEKPKAPIGDTVEELIKCLEMMLKDAKKSKKDIIDYDSTPEGTLGQ